MLFHALNDFPLRPVFHNLFQVLAMVEDFGNATAFISGVLNIFSSISLLLFAMVLKSWFNILLKNLGFDKSF